MTINDYFRTIIFLLSVPLHLKRRSESLLPVPFIRFTSIIYRQYLITMFLICSHEKYFLEKSQGWFSNVFRDIERNQWHVLSLKTLW